MNRIIGSLLCSAAVFAGRAEVFSWIGSTGSCDWNVATNWSSGTVPTGDATVVFPCDYSTYSQKLVFRLTPSADYSGTIVTTNDFTALAPSHPTYLTLSVSDGASWKVAGCGTVVATPGIAARISPDFTGTVDVPKGVEFTVPANFSESVSFTGAGVLTLDTSARMTQTAGFAGTIRLPSGMAVSAASTANFRAAALSLEDGSSLVFPEKTLAWGAIKEIPDWTVPGAWSFNAENTRLQNADSPIELDARPPFVTPEGDLRLVNDPAQSHTAFLTNRMFRVTDDWGVSFTFIPELPSDSKFVNAGKRQEMEGYFGFYLQSVSPVNVASPVHRPVPNGFGVATYLYRGGYPHIGWHLNADGAMPKDMSVKEMDLGGITFARAVDYDVICMDGVLTVTISQEGRSFSMRKSLKEGYLDARSQGVYIGFGGACSWWSADSYPWTQMTLRGFKGWYRAREAGAWRDVQGSVYPFSSDNWILSRYNVTGKTVETAGINADGSFDIIPYEYQKAVTASCKLPLSAEKRYLIDVDVKWPRMNKGLCEGMTLALGKRKPVTGSYIFEHKSGWQFDEWAYSIGLKQHLYDNGYVEPYLDFKDTDSSRQQESLRYSGLLPISNGKEVEYSLGYDPSGDMEWVLAMTSLSGDPNSGSIKPLRHVFDSVKMGKFRARKGEGASSPSDMFLLMCGASANWGAVETVVHGVSVKELSDNNAPKLGRVSVASNASATLVADASFPDSSTPAMKLSGVDLSNGATLTVSTDVSAVRVSADEICMEGDASVVASEGVTVMCSRFVYGTDGSTVRLGGSVSLGESLTLVVPNVYRRASGEKVLMDVSAATAEGGFPEVVSVLDEHGVDRSGSCVVYLRDGLVRMASKGLTITVK